MAEVVANPKQRDRKSADRFTGSILVFAVPLGRSAPRLTGNNLTRPPSRSPNQRVVIAKTCRLPRLKPLPQAARAPAPPADEFCAYIGPAFAAGAYVAAVEPLDAKERTAPGMLNIAGGQEVRSHKLRAGRHAKFCRRRGKPGLKRE
jgi:hypothetical protein